MSEPVSIREQILVAAFSKLKETPGFTTIDRNRLTEIKPEQCPALDMLDGGQSGTDLYHGQTEYTLRFSVMVSVKSKPSSMIGAALSDGYARVVKKMLEDRTLGGLCTFIREDDTGMSDPIFDENINCAAASVNFYVAFTTVPGDPYQPGP